MNEDLCADTTDAAQVALPEMTNEQKMIWAAVFGAGYIELLSDTPLWARHSKESRVCWRDNQMTALIKSCSHAVSDLSKSGVPLVEQHGTDSVIVKRYQEMVMNAKAESDG